MAMTMADLAASTKEPLLKGVVNALLDDADATGGGNLLQVLPIGNIGSLNVTVTKLNTEGSSTGVATRAIGQGFPESTIAPYQESFNVANVGGDIMIDLAFYEADNYVEGATPDVLQVEAKTKLINRTVNNLVMNGDRATDPSAFNGIRKWLDPSNVLNVTDVDSSKTSGINVGSGFSTTDGKTLLSCLDRLIDYVGGEKNAVIIGNWYLKWAILKSVRDSSLFATTKDQYERTITTYRDVPIVNPGSKTAVELLATAINNTNSVIPNNFTFGGASTATEIYVIRKGVDDGCALYNTSPLKVRTVANEMQSNPAKLIRIDWYPTFYPKKKSSIACLKGVIVV